ncbi:low molecular weight protein-tyrosine-phosphatase [Prosthecochloris sp. SCSIO W1103]|uniref:low molecular weight protein-tyrosine-phosphatase n=1 Tax=Prosthecochloris sp. SCSIO W1103 TaxID=2992244 RepID=UPI00223E00C1|nr:low molecular weight protein-tyrosine-phosphatase [Prosthecochloris sp. SCSIO W1103]UZJ38067.1 low molecular weight phosphotyrosine protein phosphatase [Prosthecochloris sp. SCSIO W1103]
MTCSLLFVCYENICRSSMAEGIFTKMIAEREHEEIFDVESAGTVCFQKGAPPDSRAIEIAREQGVDIADQRAGCIKDLELDYYTRIFTMDGQSYHDTIHYSASQRTLLPVYMVTDYLSDPETTEIEDPYYGTKKDFLKVFQQLEEALVNIYEELLRQSGL